ncbi:uncharacterized protein PHACADRAFT_260714 [Phanerochaete carnosa HHB-10118-sp]|uniref:Zn(2)-C6 fungal-type domain-containing protein n=1 Tax=Phanerochaete carnosa (strain HHB-10118-sp) TaxID=650164 RepID=K5WPX6_PHACS|nr:uncharacterized protein PHACADRAFT_260714 [Phanerochaete carnosa HHB-10118-sp]EKM52382.1 hypothetical protein PHACADRAFT_260714 [Phanerochaete carnosa HHB-10118-sp]
MSESQTSNPQGHQENELARIPRRTPMACSFCRGRKLKCDGRQTCGNCERRGIPCVYVPVSAQQK